MTRQNAMTFFDGLSYKFRKTGMDMNEFYIHHFLKDSDYYVKSNEDTKVKVLGVALEIFYDSNESKIETVIEFVLNNMKYIVSAIEENFGTEEMGEKVDEWLDDYYNNYC